MRIGIDLGGTKIEGVALSSDGTELWRQRVPCPANDYAAIIAAMSGLVAAGDQAAGTRCSVGVGIPGAIDPTTGLVKNANTTKLIGNPLHKDLGTAIGRPVRVANDANCFVVSEATDGAAAGAHIAFGVIIGTGTGGGIAIDGRPITGRHAIAGEWGHNPLPWPTDEERPGPPCYCGLHGCIETFLSGPGLALDHVTVTGEAITGAEIVKRALDGDPAADATLARYEVRLAKALATIINVIDPDVIVLGGGLSQIARLYDTVPKHWQKWVMSRTGITTPLVPPKFGDSSGVRGAAWLWPPQSHE